MNTEARMAFFLRSGNLAAEGIFRSRVKTKKEILIWRRIAKPRQPTRCFRVGVAQSILDLCFWLSLFFLFLWLNVTAR